MDRGYCEICHGMFRYALKLVLSIIVRSKKKLCGCK